MTMPPIPASVRADAATSLTGHCVIEQPGFDDFDQATGLIVTFPPVTVYTGPCSLGAPALGNRTSPGADDQLVSIRILRIVGPLDQITPGCVARVDGEPDMVVDRVQSRTTNVLPRVRLVDPRPTEGVPA